MKKEQENILIQGALTMRRRSYVPYSGFAVGAALLAKSGKIYQGCNIENISFSATNCAERTAIFKAVSEGELQFTGIAVAGGKAGNEPKDFCFPCAVCLQVMSEFCSPGFEILIVKSEHEVKHYKLQELLPFAFDSLGKE
mgnify:CR=1 FL=1